MDKEYEMYSNDEDPGHPSDDENDDHLGDKDLLMLHLPEPPPGYKFTVKRTPDSVVDLNNGKRVVMGDVSDKR